MKCINKSFNKLKDHQIKVVNKLIKHGTLLVVHGTGSGKTLSSIASAECLLDRGLIDHVIVATPRSLVENFIKEILHTYKSDNMGSYSISTYIKTLKYNFDEDDILGKSLLIIDEAHNLRTEIKYHRTEHDIVMAGKSSNKYIKMAKKCKYVMLLSATPMINRPSELNNLVQMLSQTGETMSQLRFQNICFELSSKYDIKKQINHLFFKKGNLNEFKESVTITPMGVKLLSNMDFYEPKESKYYPKMIFNKIEIEMTGIYYKDYMRIEKGKVKKLSKLKSINIDGNTSSRYYTTLRKYTNAITADESKINWVVEKLKDNNEKNRKTLIYSQFLGTGINLITKELDLLNIEYRLVTGKVSSKKIKKNIIDFNNDISKILLISRAGGEGLDLKGTNDVILLEPFWNKNSMSQVIGRAVRYKSHYHLPKGERVVNVYQLLLVKPLNKFKIIYYQLRYLLLARHIPSVDRYLYLLSSVKQRRIDQFTDKLKELNP